MSWSRVDYSKKQIKRAGEALVSGSFRTSDGSDPWVVLDNWRSSHAFPLNTIQMWMRQAARHIDSDALVAQRLKRTSSIVLKLRRFKEMNLDRMQDIGGCRVVFSDVQQVYQAVEKFPRSKAMHEYERGKDYIKEPKPDGYRGIHLIYKFKSNSKPQYNGLRIEIQVRTALQHAWATAVETADTFLPTAIKAGKGTDKWRHFFRLVSSAFALKENSPVVVPAHSDPVSLAAEIDKAAKQLDVWRELNRYRVALRVVETKMSAGARRKNDGYAILMLDPDELRLVVKPYSKRRVAEAAADYLAEERRSDTTARADVVLVKIGSAHALRKAYPNYFMDTEVFLNELDGFLSEHLEA